MRSPFTAERPPPPHARSGVPVVIGWELAAYAWRVHLPDPLSGGHACARCGLRMPCPCWRFADAFLADALQPAPSPPNTPADDATRELPRFQQRPALPRRRPGTHLEAEERYDGWFTR